MDPERTVLDMVGVPRAFGGLSAGIETLETHLGRLDLDGLIAYAVRYDVGAVVKRLGWMLEVLGVPGSVTNPLRTYPVRTLLPVGSLWPRRRNSCDWLASARQPASRGRRCRPLTK